MHILRGLPASGKSTMAKILKEKYADKVTVICRDEMRKTMSRVNDEEDRIIRSNLESRKDVVIDSLNIEPSRMDKLKTIAKETGAEVKIYEMTTPLSECIRRDKLRDDSVGSKVIYSYYHKYMKG